MIFAGLQKHSLIDYPGKVSCVAFATGCNFTCPYCHNPELAKGLYPERISEEALLAFLEPRCGFLDGVVITGGEPTLKPDLADLCAAIGRMGLSVKLDTNGSRPRILRRLVESACVDFIAMDLKTAPAHYRPPLCREPMRDRIVQSIDVVMNSGVDYEFRTTCVRPFVDELTFPQLINAIRGARRYVLQRCRTSSILDPRFARTKDAVFGDDALSVLQEMASSQVDQCIVR